MINQQIHPTRTIYQTFSSLFPFYLQEEEKNIFEILFIVSRILIKLCIFLLVRMSI